MNRPHIKASIGFFSSGRTYLLTGVGIFCLMLLRTIKLHRSQDEQCVEKRTKGTLKLTLSGGSGVGGVGCGGGALNRHQSSLNKMHEKLSKRLQWFGVVELVQGRVTFTAAQCNKPGEGKILKGKN